MGFAILNWHPHPRFLDSGIICRPYFLFFKIYNVVLCLWLCVNKDLIMNNRINMLKSLLKLGERAFIHATITECLL